MITLKYGFRNFQKNKITGILSILSLGVGVSVFLLIGTWFLNEISFDNFHHEPESIYRVCRKGFINNESVRIGSVFAPLGEEIRKEIPEISDMVRLFNLGDNAIITINGQKNYQGETYAVDSTFFTFFNFGLKTGSIQSFFDNPNSILIDESFAKKYFANKNPIGEIVSFHGQREIAGVLYDPPVNTHLRFHALIPMYSIKYLNNNTWGDIDAFNTYVRISKNSNLSELETKITSIAVRHVALYKTIQISHFLQPLQSIHFSTNFRFDSAISINPKLVYTFGLIGLIILIAASINFINLFISTSFLRAKSIGIKKANGARQKHLVRDFYIETAVYVFVATGVGLLLAQLFLPLFNSIIEYRLTLGFNSKQLYVFVFGLILCLTLLVGTFPAFQMSRFNTVETLKEKFRGKKISWLQETLFVVQFTATMAILISVILIREQIIFMKNTDLGFSKDQIVYIHLSGNLAKNYKRICQELEKNTAIEQVTIKQGTPLDWRKGHPISKYGKTDATYIAEVCPVLPNYFDMMDMPIIIGEAFEESESDKYCILNEKAVEMLGLTDPIGERIVSLDNTYIVKGIVKNAYTKSLHQEIDPQLYVNLTNYNSGHVLMVRPRGNPVHAIELLKQQWESANPQIPFAYHFLDEDYEKLYKTESKAGKIVTWSVVVVLLITLAGLCGMARYATERRVKEIGVRKVNGAKVTEILTMLNKDFIKWLVVSFFIACPFGWFLMNSWLDNFALRTPMHWWIFVLSGIIPLFTAVIAITWQSWRAARMNSVEALRYE